MKPAARQLTGREVVTLTGFLVFAGYLAMFVGLAWTGSWFQRPDGTPRPSDFMVFWAASELILGGAPLAPYDRPRLEAAVFALTRADESGLFAFFYPPTFLFAVAPLGLLPPLAAWAAWIAATLGAFALSLRAVLGHLGVALALGLPASIGCVVAGQNGFLTAALMAGTLHLLDRRPWLAGILLGALTYKPHFGPLFPLVLLATARWKPALSATLTALALAAAAELAFGPGAWASFLVAMQDQALALLHAGAWDWRKIQSAFGITRGLGGPQWLATLLQAALALVVAILVLWIWRRPGRAALRNAALVAGAMLVPPYVFSYDWPVQIVAIAFLLRDGLDHGLGRGEKAALLVAAAAPLLQIAWFVMTLPVAAVILLWIAVRRTARA